MRKNILIISHGSRERSANQAFSRMVKKFNARHPRWNVKPAHLDLARPSIHEGLRTMVRGGKTSEILVLPYFLFTASHVKKDIPKIIKDFRKDFPGVKVIIAKPLGSSSKLLELLDHRLNQALLKYRR